MYTEEVNKIAPSGNDDKRLQTFDKVTTYPYGANAIKVCESEMMILRDFFVKNYADCSFYDKIILQMINFMIPKMKTRQNTILIGHIFQIIHTEY